MTEKVVIPPADQIEVEPRRFTTKKPGEYKPFEPGDDGSPEMVKAGDGYNIHVTGLTHDERGYPDMTPAMQDKLVRRLQTKILDNAEKIWMYEAAGHRRRRRRGGLLRHHLAGRRSAPSRWLAPRA